MNVSLLRQNIFRSCKKTRPASPERPSGAEAGRLFGESMARINSCPSRMVLEREFSRKPQERYRWVICLSLLLLTAAAGFGQRHRDPFTPTEIDEIRDASWEPEQRLGLYLKFARERLAGLEQIRNDPKVKDRAQQTHDKLDEFLLIYDELNDNIDTYVGRKNDIRKPLKLIIDADTEFQAKLLALRDAAGVAQEESKRYEFSLTNALDTVDSSVEDHRELLAKQQEAAKHGKKGYAKPGSKTE